MEDMSDWLGVRGCSDDVIHNDGDDEGTNDLELEVSDTDDDMINVQGDAYVEEEKRKLDVDHEVLDFLRNSQQKKNQIKKTLNICDMDEEWQVVTKKEKKRRKDMISRKLKESACVNKKTRTDMEKNIFVLTLDDRWKLYRTWRNEYTQVWWGKIQSLSTEFNKYSRMRQEIRDKESIHVMKNVKVIGMTTTGAAKMHSLVTELSPSIVIIEEAAEVLEAHIVANLTSSCQHLILIGDHQQLKPSVTVYELCKKYHLDISLFERLINNGVEYKSLNLQHRMLPAISKLLVPHIYKDLKDHSSVECYPKMKGVMSNMFFITHEHYEDTLHDGQSKQNDYEADYIVALCTHLIKQGYDKTKITILTTYSGQQMAFKNRMHKGMFEGVVVSTVDNFQGEENDIILLSLVRSNQAESIGFLSIENRVCVALSRARHALYCIGNFKQLCSKSELWENILGYVHETKLIGNNLTLCCQLHPEYKQDVSGPSDFADKFPDGGCTRPCQARLDCGHTCEMKCHVLDERHEAYRCKKPCLKKCSKGHKCFKQCFQECGRCAYLVEKIIPSCGHKQKMKCGDDLAKAFCQETCMKTRSCGHKCKDLCGVDCTSMANLCHATLSADLPCGHTVEVECHQQHSDLKEIRCEQKCPEILECKHKCSGNCYQCSGTRLHKVCPEECSKLLVCGHKCRQKCGQHCVCTARCETQCPHNKCKNNCSEPCVPCMEPCIRRCVHQQCDNLCSQTCTSQPCTLPCNKTLPCKHACIGLCGEKCPKKCRICHKEDVEGITERIFGLEIDDSARFVELVDCRVRHIIEAQQMDKFVEYEEKKGIVKLISCPQCLTPIRRTMRYHSSINKCLDSVELVKERMRGEEKKLGMKARQIVMKVTQKFNQEENVNSAKDKEDFMKIVREAFATKNVSNVQHLHSKEHCIWHLMTLCKDVEKAKAFDCMRRLQYTKAYYDTAQMFRELKQDTSKLKIFVTESLATKVPLTSQQQTELTNEVTRIGNFTQLACQVRSKEAIRLTVNQAASKVILKMWKMLTDVFCPFTATEETKFMSLKTSLETLLPNLGLSEVERRQILAAMKDLHQGNWFKCSNGHVYAIGECGEALEKARCPECGELVGGEGRELVGTSRQALEMDGDVTKQAARWGVNAE